MQILRAHPPNDNEHLILALSEGECRDVVEGNFGTYRREYVTSVAEVLAQSPRIIAVVSSDVLRSLKDSAIFLVKEVEETPQSIVIVLVTRKAAPVTGRRHDGQVRCFLCCGEIFSKLMRLCMDTPIGEFCFQLLNGICNQQIQVNRLLVRQLPCREERLVSIQVRPAVVMAHRGSSKYLQTALQFLMNSNRPYMLDIFVGLDLEEATIENYLDVMRQAPETQFFRVSPAPAGPYVIRQYLIEQLNNEFVIFHDSDDLSSQDRIWRQYHELQTSGADLVGCHELRINEIEQRVEAVRFPLDVSSALDKPTAASLTYEGEEPMLHATAMVIRDQFLRCGGFSTDHKIANDTQFMLRAYFSLRMRNVDEFLYVRRIHKKALTVAPETALGSSLRRSLASLWKQDFDAVKAGVKRLQDSALMPRHSVEEHVFYPIEL